MNVASKCLGAVLCISVLATLGGATRADTRQGSRERPAAHDYRGDHNRNYPARGHIVHELPRDAYVSRWRGSPYYFHSGVWYRPARSQWIVVAPPAGLIVPFLPSFYTTVWIAGAPYYHANDVYYAWRPAQRGYVVVEPPSTDASPAAANELYVYPKNGQSAEQQATDRYECHRWAVNETGFDPTQPLGGVEPQQAADKRAAYFRAMTACLDGRGYSVK
jgi:hypothetical protein